MNKENVPIKEQIQEIIQNFRLIDDDFMAAVFSYYSSIKYFNRRGIACGTANF